MVPWQTSLILNSASEQWDRKSVISVLQSATIWWNLSEAYSSGFTLEKLSVTNELIYFLYASEMIIIKNELNLCPSKAGKC